MTTVTATANTYSAVTWVAAPGSTVTIEPVSGEAVVQYTTASEADVINNAATWQNWPLGVVSEKTIDILTQNVGLRLFVLTGTASMSVIANNGECVDDPAVIWLSDARLTLSHELTCTLIPEKGPFPIYFVDTSSYAATDTPFVRDCYDIMRPTRAGECIFTGARRVENLCRYSSFLTFTGTDGWSAVNSASVAIPGTSQLCGPDGNQTAWTITRANATASSVLRSQGSYVFRAVPHVFSVWLKAGTLTTAELRVYIPAGATLVTQIVTLTNEWQRFAITGTPNGTSAYAYSIAAGSWASGTGGTVYAAFPQMEEIAGAPVAPSEYVPRDSYPISTLWSGAAIDGVQYFATSNGNTHSPSTGLVTQGVGTALSTAKGVRTYPSAQQFWQNTTTLSSATATACAISSPGATSPDGSPNALRITEDTSNAAHFIEQALTGTNTFDGKLACFSVYCKYTGASDGRPFVRMTVRNLDGSTLLSCFFNIQTGTVSTPPTNGTAYVENLGNGWMRLIWSSILLGTGASDATGRIYLSADGATITYLGASRYTDIWCPNFTAALSAGGSDKPLAVPPFHAAGAATVLRGNLLAYSVQGIMGYTDFAVASDYTPYFEPTQGNKGAYTDITGIRCESVAQNAGPGLGAYDWDRTGLSIRSNNAPTSVHRSKYAFDFYSGDLNNQYFWRASSSYSVGQIAIPTATLPDNPAPSQKMHICLVAGVTGATEPTWATTLNGTTVDGTVTWIVSEDNGIVGDWESYLGAHKVPSQQFMQTARFSWFISPDTYGCFESGVPFAKQTLALFENGFRTVLRNKPKILYVGTVGTSRGLPGAQGGASIPELLSIYTADHKRLRVYSARFTLEEGAALSS